MSDEEEDRYLPVREVARIFSVQQITVREWLRSDKVDLHGIQINGRWRVLKSEVKRFANKKFGASSDTAS